MSKDVLYFNLIDVIPPDDPDKEDLYKIPFTMASETYHQMRQADFPIIRQRMRAVLVKNGFILVEPVWLSFYVIARKRKVFTATYTVP